MRTDSEEVERMEIYHLNCGLLHASQSGGGVPLPVIRKRRPRLSRAGEKTVRYVRTRFHMVSGDEGRPNGDRG